MLRQPNGTFAAEIPLIEMKGVMARYDQKTVLNRVSCTVLPWRALEDKRAQWLRQVLVAPSKNPPLPAKSSN